MGHVPRLPPAPSTCAATSAVTDTDGPARPPRVALPTVADGVAVLVPAADASSGTVKGPTGSGMPPMASLRAPSGAPTGRQGLPGAGGPRASCRTAKERDRPACRCGGGGWRRGQLTARPPSPFPRYAVRADWPDWADRADRAGQMGQAGHCSPVRKGGCEIAKKGSPLIDQGKPIARSGFCLSRPRVC